MNIKNLVDGINTLRPYYDNPDGHNSGCEHDRFYMWATDKPVTAEDVKKLHALDWFQEETEEPGYSRGESWSAFV